MTVLGGWRSEVGVCGERAGVVVVVLKVKN